MSFFCVQNYNKKTTLYTNILIKMAKKNNKLGNGG